MNSRKKKVSLILSCIGTILYLLSGSIPLFLLYPVDLFYSLSLLLIGVISLIGTIIGVKEIKSGGAIILISIPFSIICMSILSFFPGNFAGYTFYDIVAFLLFPIPYPHSIFIIIGGIQCLRSFDD